MQQALMDVRKGTFLSEEKKQEIKQDLESLSELSTEDAIRTTIDIDRQLKVIE